MVALGPLGGRYDLGEALGAGGFGTVYRARDRRSDADVAVKLVPRGFDAERLAARLRVEATALRRVSSRHVARFFDYGEDGGAVWLVTELAAGVHLSPAALGRALLPHEVLRVARGVLEGLAAAHAAGIVHGDVKPSNVLVPLTADGLDSPKLVDFGAARAAPRADLTRELLDAEPGPGELVLGTARYLAPEVLSGGEPGPRADLYAAGLVLFELLGEGALFAGASARDEIRARVRSEPLLAGRVPEPLSLVLARMLARDPGERFADAGAAHAAVADLDTAPVSIALQFEPMSGTHASSVPSRARVSSLGPAPASATRSQPPAGALPRLSRLSPDALEALRDTLLFLDLPMLDALARRERGTPIGRTARALALALRLELDAAALILEPLAAESDVARAVGATVLAPRARRVTRARVDGDRDDRWVESVPPELGALFGAIGAAIGSRDGAARDAARCERLVARLEHAPEPDADAARRVAGLSVLLRVGGAAARVRLGELDPAAAFDMIAPLGAADPRTQTALERVTRGLLEASIATRIDEDRARDELGRAARAAIDSGSTLLEACASSAWGRLLAPLPTKTEQGLALLERAGTLLAHGDAPSLEHEAEHYRAAALVVLGRWAEAVPRLRAAREAAHAERALEAEVLSASLEVVAHLALGDRSPAREAAATLGDARIGSSAGRAAALAWVARCLEALASGELKAAEDALAEASARAREHAASDSADAFILVEVLGMLFDAAHGALGDLLAASSELERFAQERGFSSFYWFEVLRSVIERVEDEAVRGPMRDTLGRLSLLLGPASRLARERRTSAPPAFG